MSFLSWYVIIWKGLKLREEYRFYKNFQEKFSHIKDWPSRLGAEKFGGSIGIVVEEVETLEPILKNYNHEAKKEIMTMHLVQKLDEVRVGLDRGLTVLASVGSSAPFIGLFGTVWGIYNALADIAAQGNAGLSVVAGPMGEALIATAIGLFAAIPAILSYNTFVRLNRLLVQNLRHVSEQMTVYLSNK
jgi:biopolymer transport protein ExbB